MSVEWQLVLGWLAFGGTHVLLSTRLVRPHAIRVLGLRGFKAAYSVVALVTFAWLVVTYWNHRHAGETLLVPPAWGVHAAEAIMLLAFLLLGLGFAQPSAATTLAELGAPIAKEPRGIQRITRHPVGLAFGLGGLAHALVNTTTADWIFWLGWPVFTLVAALHQDARARCNDSLRSFIEGSSAFPFAAVLAGRQRVAWGELSRVGGLAGLALFVILRLLHGSLIGGFGG
jgi:uncharacterized membrane protein